MNRTWRLITAVAVIVASLTLGSAMLRAEDSGVFRNASDISRAQSILVDEGFLPKGGYTQGQLDQATRRAISEFQDHHTLNNTGILDDETYPALLSHEFTYPWSEEKTARVELAPAEPVAPVAAIAPPAQVEVAEAAPVPEPTPAPEVQEAPAPAPEPAPEPARTMPATASHLPLLALSGLGLLGLGVLVLLRRSA